jgi:hypothetical protein
VDNKHSSDEIGINNKKTKEKKAKQYKSIYIENQ